MMKFCTVVIAVVAVVLLGGVVSGADAGRESLFSLGSGARALGMGGGFTAVADDATGVYYNPAGLPFLEYQQFSAMHVTLFEGTVYDAASWGVPLVGVGGFGASFMRVGTKDIIRRSNFVNEGTFDYTTWQFLLGFGRKFGSRVSFGATLKIVNQSLDVTSDYGLGADLGFYAQVYKSLAIGVTARNTFSPVLTLDSTSDRMPLVIVPGLAVKDMRLSKAITMTVTVDGEKTKDRSLKVHTGAEVNLYRKLQLRYGFDRDNLVFGAGLSVGRVQFDYAYKVLDYIEDSHRFSVTFLVGPSVSDQLRRRQQEEQQRGTQMVAIERKHQLDVFRSRADEFYGQLQLDSALTYYQRALAFDEKNEEIIGKIAAIENIQRIKAEEERKILQAQTEQEQTMHAYYEQASFFYSRKYYSAALDLIGLILDIDPNNASARLLRQQVDSATKSDIQVARQSGLQAERDGRVLEAIEAYNRILDLSPDDQEARVAKQRISARLDTSQQLKLGIDLFNQNRLADARRQFDAVLKVVPGDPVALEYLRKMQVTAPQEATLEDIQNDKDVWPLYLEGLRHMRDKEYQKAIDAWQKVLEKYPNNSNTIDNIKQARLRMGS